MSKKDGVVYTPEDVVKRMLDMAGFFPDIHPELLTKTIMDNSCGDGNILVAVAERMCEAMYKNIENLRMNTGSTFAYFEDRLTRAIHGLELCEEECEKCKDRLNKVVSKYLRKDVNFSWDIRCCDSLACDDNRQFDFVICNPPYIRVHDFETDISGYEFVEEGMKDMYLAFYELGIRQMKKDGVMCYITPSSWFTSTAGKKLREYLYENKLISKIYDYCHQQVFDDATTYVEITVLDRRRKEYVTYESIETGKRLAIPYDNFNIDGRFYFTDRDSINVLRSVQGVTYNNIKVKNGYATLADDVFIHEVRKDDSPYVIPIVKSSTGNRVWCIYPYDRNGKLIDEYTLAASAPNSRGFLMDNKAKLLDRCTDEPWYAFGRTQAINDTFKDKWAVKSIIKTIEDINPVEAPAGTGTYGGLYILCDNPEQLECLKTEEFMNYVKSLKKYKSGGYYTFSSKDLEKYLNWKNAPGMN